MKPQRTTGARVEYFPLPVHSLAREHTGEEGWYWTIDPYQGCEMGCTFCSVRLGVKDFARWQEFEGRIGVKANALDIFKHELKVQGFSGRQVVLGEKTDPWQPAEERFRITRSLLAEMAEVEDIDLRINTRSSLVARDTDLLRQIASRGQVTVAFSLASLDEQVNRLLEPNAPSALRRLSAMEALARAGIPVGVWVSPLLPGLDAEELELEGLLTRATHAGARFAGLEFLSLPPGHRENFYAHIATAYPEAAVKFRRMVGLKPMRIEEREGVVETFELLCQKLGLFSVARQPLPRTHKSKGPSQLALFPT